MKKSISILLTLCLILTLSITAFAQNVSLTYDDGEFYFNNGSTIDDLSLDGAMFYANSGAVNGTLTNKNGGVILRSSETNLNLVTVFNGKANNSGYVLTGKFKNDFINNVIESDDEFTYHYAGYICGGSYYGSVTTSMGYVSSELSDMPELIGGGEIYGGIFYKGVDQGEELIMGKKITFMDGENFYALEVVTDDIADYVPDFAEYFDFDVSVAPDEPTKDDYTFGGWYTDEDCTDGNKYTFGQTVDEDFNLYAKWTKVVEEPTTEPTDESTTSPADEPTDDGCGSGTLFFGIIKNIFDCIINAFRSLFAGCGC